MSTTVDGDGERVAPDDLDVGDVVIVDQRVGDLTSRTFATVVEIGQRGPRVTGPGIEAATYARALKIDRVTRYDQVLGEDGDGAYHLFDRRPRGVGVIDVVDTPGDAPAHQQQLVDRSVGDWLRFVADKRGWVSIPERYLGVLDGGALP